MFLILNNETIIRKSEVVAVRATDSPYGLDFYNRGGDKMAHATVNNYERPEAIDQIAIALDEDMISSLEL